jgi:hypothetical protein
MHKQLTLDYAHVDEASFTMDDQTTIVHIKNGSFSSKYA